MRLIIVRHGQTTANVKWIHQGQLHGTLSKEGRLQVKELGRKLRKEKIDIVYSSDLRRAVHTAKAIMKYHSIPIHYVKSLREISMGVYEGRPYLEYDIHHVTMSRRPKGGESYNDLYGRIKKFTKILYKKHKNDTVLIATHGIVVKCLASIYLKIPMKKLIHVGTKNAGILILEVGKSKTKLVKEEIFKNLDV